MKTEKSVTRFFLTVVLMAVFAVVVLTMQGCASMTTEYWEERYAAMTPEEIEEAKKGGGELVRVCDLTDCLTVWVY